jgi:hypothetical protein
VSITNDNFGGLSLLCEEFHFEELAERLSQLRESDNFKEEATLKDLEARKRLLVLEERMQQRCCEIVALRTELLRHLLAQESSSEALFGRMARLEAAVSALQTASALPHSIVSAQKSPPPSIVPSASVAPAVPTSPLATPPSGPVSQSVVPIASAHVPTSPASVAAPPPSGWNSAIVPDFPKLFEDFKKKQYTLLWRGSRDGFHASSFHSRCNGHPNTLTVILDTKGNIFGGFTPVEWESQGGYKADPSLKSFIFTLKNPHNVSARRFALKAEKKDEAIYCISKFGPHFGNIRVGGNCSTSLNSGTEHFGTRYTNDTGVNGGAFFTGSAFFQVKEIEVFEIGE